MTTPKEIALKIEEHVASVLAEIGVEKLNIVKRAVIYTTLNPKTERVELDGNSQKVETMHMQMIIEDEGPYYRADERSCTINHNIVVLGRMIADEFNKLNAAPNVPAKYVSINVHSLHDELRKTSSFHIAVLYVRIK